MKIFAEIGLNHLGNPKLAINIVKECLKNKVDGITLQIQPESYYDNSKNFKRALNFKTYQKISSIIKKKKKLFGLAIMDKKTLEKSNVIKFDFLKILSLGFNDTSLIKKAINTKKKIFLSTGFADMKSIIDSSKKFANINFIHTSLDLMPKNVNLSAIRTIKKKIKNKVSYGHHSKDLEILLVSLSYFPDSIFFYVKPDKKNYYPDNEHAISLKNLPNILRLIKITQQSIGNGIKIKRRIPDWIFE